MKRILPILFILIASACFCQPVKPHTFSPADPVSSSKINANFDTIYTWGSVASAAIELHKADTAAHGATGGVVGATKTQTLTNKSISGEQINSGTVADARIDSTLARDSEVSTAVSTHAALTGTHGVTGVVGLSETQTLTNKTIGTGSTWNGNAISDAYINTAYSSAAMSTHRNSITSADTRSANYEPDDRDRGLYADFKGNSTDALSDGGSYHGVLTFRPYGNTTDMSGGHPFQLGFTENTNAWLRKATSATVWSGWYKLFHSGHVIPDGNIDAALARDSEVTSAVSTHAGLTSTHGATGAVVGTTSTQTLTNKTLTSPTINDGTTNLDGGVLIAPQTTTPAQTAEGSVVWDSDHNVLTVGNGSGRTILVSETEYQLIKDKTLDSSNSIPGEAIKSGTINTNRLDSVVITESELSSAFDQYSTSLQSYVWPVANGGTGATTAAIARTNLGVAYGTAAGTVCQGNDSRLSDARTPTSHTHSEYRKHIKNNITTAGAGWYRVARLNGSDGRGNCEVSIYTTGGSYVPQTLKISCYHDWSANAQLEVTAEGASHWSGVRITNDGSYAYVEVQFISAFNSYAYGLDPFGYDSGYTIYSGALPAGGGTVRTSVGTPGAGIFCSSTFSLSTAANSVAIRDSSGDITTRLFKSTYAEQTTAAATTADIAFRNDTSDNYIRFMSAAAFKAWLQACQIGIVQTSAPASPVNGDIWTE